MIDDTDDLRFWRGLLLAVPVGLVIWLLICLVAAGPCHACACCEDPVVKVEWDGGEWVYDGDVNDGSVVVTGTERLLCWRVISGTAISEVAVKAGHDVACVHPQGQEAMEGCYAAEWHDLSSALFCKGDPTAVGLSGFSAEGAAPEDRLGLFFLGVLSGVIGTLAGIVCMFRSDREANHE
jgi:hypothetical protein